MDEQNLSSEEEDKKLNSSVVQVNTPEDVDAQPKELSPQEPVENKDAVNTVQHDKNSNFWRKNQFLAISLVIYGIDLLIYFVVMSTNSYQLAANLASMTFYIGIVAPFLLGAAAIKLIMNDPDFRLSSPLMVLGIILLVSSVYLQFLGLLLAIICITVGVARQAAKTKTDKPISNARIAMAVLGFIVAGVVGVVVAGFIYLSTSTKACELSGSKCL